MSISPLCGFTLAGLKREEKPLSERGTQGGFAAHLQLPVCACIRALVNSSLDKRGSPKDRNNEFPGLAAPEQPSLAEISVVARCHTHVPHRLPEKYRRPLLWESLPSYLANPADVCGHEALVTMQRAEGQTLFIMG